MTKLSSKMHILIVISSIIIALGLALGLIFHFTSGSFFNYGGDYKTVNTVTVNYALADQSETFSKDSITEECNKVFEENGVCVVTKTYAETTQGGEIVFQFAAGEETYKTLQTCVEKITANLKLNDASMSGLSVVAASQVNAVKGGCKALLNCGIAIIVAAVLQFVYLAIRYKWTMAIGAFLANVHNLAIFIALLAITRIQISSAVFAFGAITVLATMIGCGILFGKMRKAFNAESNAKVDAKDVSDAAACDSLKPMAVLYLALVIALVVIALVSAIGSLSFASLIMPALCAVVCFISTLYGTAIFTPSVYSRLAAIHHNKANS